MDRTILMIHGMWSGGWVWENYKDFFGNKRYACITPTLKHHDINPDAPADYRLGTTSLRDYVDELEQLIHKLATPPILMGHSMGALIAQILTGRGLAEATVLLAPAAPYGIMALRPSVVRTFLTSLIRWKFWSKPIRPTYSEASFGLLSLMPEHQRQSIYDRMVYESGRAAAEIGFWYFDPHQASKVDATTIKCPMLIMTGMKDRLTPASVIRKIVDKYQRNAVYHEFSNHAHWILAEPGWQTVAQTAMHWLDKVLESTPLSSSLCIEQRKYPRISFHAPMHFIGSDSDKRQPGELANYSIRGASFLSDVKLLKGTEINIELLDCVPGFDGPKANDVCKAEVIWCAEKEDKTHFDIGVRFYQ